MHIASIVFLRRTGSEAQQISEDLVRDAQRRVNEKRSPNDRVFIGYFYLVEDGDARINEKATMAIRCGVNHKYVFRDGIHYFQSIGQMQDGIVLFLNEQFPPQPEHPELDLGVSRGRIEAPKCCS